MNEHVYLVIAILAWAFKIEHAHFNVCSARGLKCVPATADFCEHVVKSLVKEPSVELFVDWSPYLGHDWSPYFNTSIPLTTLQALGRKLVEIPNGFSLQRQVKKLFDDL